jgi:hypothetical protein
LSTHPYLGDKRKKQNNMKKKLLIVLILYLIGLPVIFGLSHFFGGIKYVHPEKTKKELLINHRQLIKDGNVIQGFPYDGWNASYYPVTNRDWFYPKIHDYFYKWSIYYRFKWLDRC